jgi:hypothetical protein
MTRHQREDSRPDEPTLRETRFEDFDYDETGKEYLYYYAGWTCELFIGDRGYVLRYEDTPEEISFHLVEYNVRAGDDLLHPRALGEGYIRGGFHTLIPCSSRLLGGSSRAPASRS